MKTKYNTITVGIPAYNEQVNIARLVVALTKQRTTGSRRISEIVVVSDGSTDSTVNQVKSIKSSRIKLVSGTSRKGKNSRLNSLFEMVSTDVLVVLDADIVLEGEYVIDTLVKGFRKLENVGLVAGNAQPITGKTLIENAVNNFIESLNFMKNRIRKGQNIYSVRGPILGFSKDFAQKLVLPMDVPDDRYSYFACMRLGYNFYFESAAKVYFRSPKNLKDQIKQCKRFRMDRKALSSYITQQELNEAYFLPLTLKLQALLFQITRNPLAYLTMKYIQLFDHATRESKANGIWEIAQTTKSFL